jgi:NitT/TauT family transport system substrate-binding protein
VRRAPFALSAAAFALAPAGVPAQTAGKPMLLGTAPNEDALAALWGRESGAFARAGIDLTIQKSNSGSAVAAAVAGRALDVGKSNIFSVIAAHARGLPFVVIAPAAVYDSRNSTVSLVVAPNSPLKTGRDLNGKVMGAPGLDDLAVIGVKRWMDTHGGDSSTLSFVEIPNSAISSTIVNGRIDMGVMEQPALARALGTGSVRDFCHPFDAIGNRFVWAAYFTTSDYIAKNHDAVRAFQKVIAEGGAYVNAHHAETVDVLAKFTGMEASVIASMQRTTLGTSLDVRMLQPVIDVAAIYKVIPQKYSAQSLTG